MVPRPLQTYKRAIFSKLFLFSKFILYMSKRETYKEIDFNRVSMPWSTLSLSQPQIMGMCMSGILGMVFRDELGTFPQRSALTEHGVLPLQQCLAPVCTSQRYMKCMSLWNIYKHNRMQRSFYSDIKCEMDPYSSLGMLTELNEKQKNSLLR